MKYIAYGKSSAILILSLFIFHIQAIPITPSWGARQIAVKIADNMKIPVTATGTIGTAGSYILANDITGPITISTSNVSLDLNGHKITGQVTIGGAGVTNSNVSIYNGMIENTTDCIVLSGTSVRFVTIRDIVMYATGAGEDGVNMSASRVDNLVVRNCWIRGSGGAASYGVRLTSGASGVGNNSIENCTIQGFETAISVEDYASPTTIKDNVIQGCGESANHAVRLVDSISASAKGNIVRNNLLQNNYAGIYVYTGQTQCFIFQNVITGCTSATAGKAITDGSSSNQIYGNYAYNNNGTPANNYSGLLLVLTAVAATSGMYENVALA